MEAIETPIHLSASSVSSPFPARSKLESVPQGRGEPTKQEQHHFSFAESSDAMCEGSSKP